MRYHYVPSRAAATMRYTALGSIDTAKTVPLTPENYTNATPELTDDPALAGCRRSAVQIHIQSDRPIDCIRRSIALPSGSVTFLQFENLICAERRLCRREIP
jgi:hypothetical protein